MIARRPIALHELKEKAPTVRFSDYAVPPRNLSAAVGAVVAAGCYHATYRHRNVAVSIIERHQPLEVHGRLRCCYGGD